MSSLNDTIALGLVLVLLFGAAALYLYTRVQQCEQKLNLVESILLDIKMGAELREYPDLGITTTLPKVHNEEALYSAALAEAAIDSIDVTDATNVIGTTGTTGTTGATGTTVASGSSGVAEEAAEPAPTEKQAATSGNNKAKAQGSKQLTVNYEAMTLVELKELARQRSIKGFSTMRRSQILEALKSNETAVPSKLNEEILSSLLEQAASFEEEGTLSDEIGAESLSD